MQAKEAGQVNADSLLLQLLPTHHLVWNWPVKTIQDPGSTGISHGLCTGSGAMFGLWQVTTMAIHHAGLKTFVLANCNQLCVGLCATCCDMKCQFFVGIPWDVTWGSVTNVTRCGRSALKKLCGDCKTANALHHMPPCIAIFQLASRMHFCHTCQWCHPPMTLHPLC